VALFSSDPTEIGRALAFVAEGAVRGEACAFLAYARLNERFAAQMRDLFDFDTHRALLEGSLAFMNGHESAKLIRTDLAKFFVRAKRIRKPGRLLVSLGWGEAGWPDEAELIELELYLGELCSEHSIAGLCLYDVRQLTAQQLLLGGLHCHASAYSRGALHQNPFHAKQADLQRELSTLKREESRLRTWMS
jgi:hypothetical protein